MNEGAGAAAGATGVHGDESVRFVGGSREGLPMAGVHEPILTFVNGLPVRTAKDGSIDYPLNALIETYLLEEVTGRVDAAGSPVMAYFLVGLETEELVERWERLQKCR